MVAELAAVLAVVITLTAELLHSLRIRRLAPLAFGYGRRPSALAYAAPAMTAISVGLLVWGLTTLYLLPAKTHRAAAVEDALRKHVVVMLDVSPSMRLQDAGMEAEQSRIERGWEVLHDFFKRVPITQYRVSVVAFYSSAMPVVVDTSDAAVLENIMGQLPLQFAFASGKTDLFAGLDQVAKTAKPWRPGSTSLIVLSDGETVPGKGMPKMPASINDVLVVGVGDDTKGTFLNGQQSRQDVSTLKQLALRLNGSYVNGNHQALSGEMLATLMGTVEASVLEQLGKREYALWAIAIGSSILAFLPLVLHFAGTQWRPGVHSRSRVHSSGPAVPVT